MLTGQLGQADFCPYALREVSVLTESTFGHLRYTFEGVPPQSNSPSSHVLERYGTAWEGAPTQAGLAVFLHCSSPLPPPHPFDRVQGHPSSRRSFNRMKCIETPQPPSCAPTVGKAKGANPSYLPSRRNTLQMAGRPAFRPASCTSPTPPPRRGTKYPGEGRTREGRLPKSEGFLGPGGMRKRFALAALRSPSQVETRTGGALLCKTRLSPSIIE